MAVICGGALLLWWYWRMKTLQEQRNLDKSPNNQDEVQPAVDVRLPLSHMLIMCIPSAMRLSSVLKHVCGINIESSLPATAGQIGAVGVSSHQTKSSFVQLYAELHGH